MPESTKDTFTVTAYDANTQTVTATVVLKARDGYAGATLTAIKLQGCPTDSVESVKAFFRGHADGYIRGKMQEEQKKQAVSPEVAALLNKVTEF